MAETSKEAKERVAAARLLKKQAADENRATVLAELAVEARRVEEKTARLRKLRLAKEAADAKSETPPQSPARRKPRKIVRRSR